MIGRWRRAALATLGTILATCSLSAQAPQRGLHIGYVYPAGGQQGQTFEVVVGGQFLTGVASVDVSGQGVQARIVELIQPISSKELNLLRIKADDLLARKAVVQNDFRALDAFRSLKNANSVKAADEAKDRDLEELKKKYAGATWTEADEAELRDVRGRISSGVRRPANPAIGELAIVEITVATDARPGPRELRMVSTTGLSNPLAFHVGGLPEVSAEAVKSIAEQKSSIQRTGFAPKGKQDTSATQVTIPSVVNGQLMPGKVDRYRFAARAGQRLVVVASARELIPYIADAVPGWFQATLAVFNARGEELAYDDDFQFHPDPVLYCRIPEDGEYVVEIKDAIYRGREDFVYRITVGEVPFVTSIFPLGGPAGSQTNVELTGWNLPANRLKMDNRQRNPGIHRLESRGQDWLANQVPFAVDDLPERVEKEPNNETATSESLQLPIIVNGRIGEPDDVDVFCFEGRAGDEIVAEVNARRLNSPLDSVLKLVDDSGRQLAVNDDYEDRGAGLTTHHADSLIRFTLPADGKYYVQLLDMQHQGGAAYAYRLRISPPRPGFELRVSPASVSARAGATVPLNVFVSRRDGYAGEIQLELKDPPPGFKLSGKTVPVGQDQVRATLTMPKSASPELMNLELVGRATVAGQEIVERVVPAEDMMQAFAYRHLVPAQQLRVAVTGRELASGLLKIVGKGPARIPAGGTGRVDVSAPAWAALEQVDLQLSDPPEGISIQKVARSAEGIEVHIQSDAAKVQAGQQGNLILTVSLQNASASNKQAKADNSGRSITLPAVPFEVVEP